VLLAANPQLDKKMVAQGGNYSQGKFIIFVFGLWSSSGDPMKYGHGTMLCSQVGSFSDKTSKQNIFVFSPISIDILWMVTLGGRMTANHKMNTEFTDSRFTVM
jgi:hypothetical protein